jgi:prevent-host-death family protein
MRSISQLDEVEEMARTISATEAKAKLSSLINWAIKNRDEVVVESRGTPKAAILPYEAYEQYKELREQARRRQLLAQLEELAAQVQTRNQDLSGEAADELSDRFSREVIEEMVEEGKVRYQRD